MAVIAEAGISVVGENRLQDLEAKVARHGQTFEWHFIGHLQSRKTRGVSRHCALLHSLDSLSAARRLSIPTLVEVNLAGETTKSGVPAHELPDFLGAVRELGVEVRGLMTMPPLSADPEESRPYFRELRRLAQANDLSVLSMGTSQDYVIATQEGASHIRVGSVLYEG